MAPLETLLAQTKFILNAAGVAGSLEGGDAIPAISTGHLYLKGPALGTPFLVHPKFALNTGGVAGFFGGDEVISAMATVHLYEHRWWLGWFNSSGSHTVARHFGKVANSRFWNGLFPGPNDSPAVSLGLDGNKGPKYIAPLSGTRMRAGHLAYLMMKLSKTLPLEEIIGGRTASSGDVAYLVMNPVNCDAPVGQLRYWKAFYALFPIASSVATCVTCALYGDWFISFLILFGMFSGGLATAIIGQGELAIETVREPAAGSPPGDGILIGKDGIMVIRGEERDVNAITKGRFIIRPVSRQNASDGGESDSQRSGGSRSSVEGERQGEEENVGDGAGGQGGRQHEEENAEDGPGVKGNDQSSQGIQLEECHNAIGICSIFLLFQFIFQLLLVPQGTLLGQIMFLVSLASSWMYNSYLSSLEKEKIQAKMLYRRLRPRSIRRFHARTRTTMAVFACLLLFHKTEHSSEEEDINCRIWILEEFIPNKTGVWRLWRERDAAQLLNPNDNPLPHLVDNKQEPQLLRTLLGDARAAFEMYSAVSTTLGIENDPFKTPPVQPSVE